VRRFAESKRIFLKQKIMVIFDFFNLPSSTTIFYLFQSDLSFYFSDPIMSFTSSNNSSPGTITFLLKERSTLHPFHFLFVLTFSFEDPGRYGGPDTWAKKYQELQTRYDKLKEVLFINFLIKFKPQLAYQCFR